jgi:Domain of unknown function (DUF6457)
MDGWLEESRARLAAAAGEKPSTYDLSLAEMDELLELARVAAHESGERTNAPLLCYLIGRADRGGDLQKLSKAIETSV